MDMQEFTALMQSIKVDSLLTYQENEARYGRWHPLNTLTDVRVTDIYPPHAPISRQRLEQLYPEQEQDYPALASMGIWRFVVEDTSVATPANNLQPDVYVIGIIYDFICCGRQSLTVTGAYMPEAPSYMSVYGAVNGTPGNAAFVPSAWASY